MSRIAIIGTGIAGMGCAHFLHRHHDLTLFEANHSAGGDAHTVDVVEPGTSRPLSIDTGFMVYNEAASPLLARLFSQLQVPLKKTSVTFAMRDDVSGLEWNGASLNRLFAQRKNLLRPRFLKLLAAIRRFNNEAVAALKDPALAQLTVGDYVRQHGYGEDFFNLHLAPLGAALWRTPPEHFQAFPAAPSLRFLHNHGFLRFRNRHEWLTVDGGSRHYRDRLSAPFNHLVQRARPAVRIIRNGMARGATVITADGAAQAFDQVIVATQADQALRLLVNPTPDEIRLLSEFKYQSCVTALHTDTSVLPHTPLARAAWNHQRIRDSAGRIQSTTHVWMNRLQGVSDLENYIVSSGRPDAIDPAKVINHIDSAHPLFNLGTLRAQAELPKLNVDARNRTETYFVGGYFGNGFHEDSLASAVKLSELILGRDPWTAPGPEPSLATPPNVVPTP